MDTDPTTRRPARAWRPPTAPALALAAAALLSACGPTSTPDAAAAAAEVAHPASRPVSTATPSARATASTRASATASATSSATPSTATSTATPTPTSIPAPSSAPAPEVTITCPPGGAVSAATFDHTVAAAAPYTVTMTYGDGRSYTGDDQHLASVFAHTYAAAGRFDVAATVTDAAGRTAGSTCTWTRTAPVAAVRAATPGAVGSGTRSSSGTGGSTGTGSSTGGDGDTYTNVDGNAVHRPVAAPSAPAGATAHCGDGTYSFSQHRSGTCSHHGGVASWL